ncbi:MAG TPA: hypothetical protein VGI45_03070 [Terracidiphilus sp.]|jgi:hypothetical protein
MSCRNVTLRDGVLYCHLERDKRYVLTEAYEDNLHVRFANADSEKELVDFIRGWGPLWIPHPYPSDDVVSLPLAECRAYQKQMKALIGALTAFKWGKGEREALEELIEAFGVISGEDQIKSMIPNWTTGSVGDWVKGATLPDVRAVTNLFAAVIGGGQFPLNLTFLWRGKRRRVLAGWNFGSLRDALHWMVWYDEFTKHPVICCAECRTIFRGEDARPRKYCSDKCAHKATARDAMRKKRGWTQKQIRAGRK